MHVGLILLYPYHHNVMSMYSIHMIAKTIYLSINTMLYYSSTSCMPACIVWTAPIEIYNLGNRELHCDVWWKVSIIWSKKVGNHCPTGSRPREGRKMPQRRSGRNIVMLSMHWFQWHLTFNNVAGALYTVNAVHWNPSYYRSVKWIEKGMRSVVGGTSAATVRPWSLAVFTTVGLSRITSMAAPRTQTL